MPTYDYACPACGGFEALRSLSQRDEPCNCPDWAPPRPASSWQHRVWPA